MNQKLKQHINNINKGIIPKGYKKTKLGIIPEVWSIQKAKEIFENISNKNHNGDLKVLSATQDRGVIPRDQLEMDIKYDRNNLVNYKKVERGNFVISLRSFQGGIEYSEFEGLISPAYTILKNKIPISNKYYRDLLKTKNFIKRLDSVIYGIRDGKQIGYKDFSELYLPYPPLPEQQKIANILTTWDKAIELKEQLIEQKQAQKKGFMQNLLTGKVRLKGFTEEWKEVKLGEITSIGTGAKDNQNKDVNGKYPFYVRSAKIEKINSYSFDGEAILIPGDGRIGEIFHYIVGKFDYHQRVYRISDFKNNINGKFIYFFLKQFFYKQAISNSVKATVDSLRMPTIQNMKINLPEYSEQKEIAKILSNSDKELEFLNQELESLKEQKKGLMQLLLTGKVRVEA